MANVRDLSRRIKSVNSTKQITKAMNLVAASKLTRAKTRQSSTRPFFTETERVIASIVKNSKGVKHPFLEQREEKKVAIIIITSDRGLCGGYNANISKAVLNFVNEKGKENVKLVVVGNKGRDFFKRREVEILESVTGISEAPTYVDASKIGSYVFNLFEGGEVDSVYIGYTEFISTIQHEVALSKLLPVDTSTMENEEVEGKGKALGLMRYEPSEEEVLNYVVPKYINTMIYGALVESAACEQGARMTSMDNATENATAMIDNLTIVKNRARQSAITQEITEIVGGAAALE